MIWNLTNGKLNKWRSKTVHQIKPITYCGPILWKTICILIHGNQIRDQEQEAVLCILWYISICSCRTKLGRIKTYLFQGRHHAKTCFWHCPNCYTPHPSFSVSYRIHDNEKGLKEISHPPPTTKKIVHQTKERFNGEFSFLEFAVESNGGRKRFPSHQQIFCSRASRANEVNFFAPSLDQPTWE